MRFDCRCREVKDLQNRPAPKNDFHEPIQADLACPALGAKIFLFTKIGNHAFCCRPAAVRGALRDRHGCWRQDAMDALAVRDERGRCGRRSRVVLSPRRWGQALRDDDSRRRWWLKSPAHQGEHEAAVKTIAQGMPVVPALPVVTAACFPCCRRAMGAACIRHSLCPLLSRDTNDASLGRNPAARMLRYVLLPCRRPA